MPGIRDFRGKVAVVTGAASGIGRATALALAREGCVLALADIDAAGLDGTAREIHARDGKAASYVVDVSNQGAVVAFAREAISAHSRVDILFNNAGVGISGTIADTPLERWEWLVGVNYWGVVFGIKAFLPHFLERGSGHIVSTSSLAGLVPAPGLGVYASTKFAVLGLSEALRVELRDRGIGVSTICPGVIKTNIPRATEYMVSANAKRSREEIIATFERYAWPPERVAKAVIKAIRRDRAIVPVGPEAWLLWYAMRISPRIAERIFLSLHRRLMG